MEEGKKQGVYQTERRERKRADFYRDCHACGQTGKTIIDFMKNLNTLKVYDS